jgi:hypothetical protein
MFLRIGFKGIYKAKDILKSVKSVTVPGRVICFLVMSGRIVCFLVMSGRLMQVASIMGIRIVQVVVVRHAVMSHIKQDHASQKYEYVVLSFQESANIVF